MSRSSQGAAQRADSFEDGKHLGSESTPGLSDIFGERVLAFDTSTSSYVERLTFRSEFGSSAAFQEALRQRVGELTHFRHPSIAHARGVEWASAEGALILISNHAVGRRLSEIQSEIRGLQFAADLVSQLVPVLAALQEQGKGIAHGLLSAERVVVTPSGQLVIADHVLATAVDALDLDPEKLRAFGLIVPRGATKLDDPRNDVVQLGYMALSLLVGRQISSFAMARDIIDRLNSQSAGHERETPRDLRTWIARALQLDTAPFASANDADRALSEWPKRGEVSQGRPPHEPRAERPRRQTVPGRLLQAPENGAPASVLPPPSLIPDSQRGIPLRSTPQPQRRVLHYLASGLAVVCLVESFIIAALLYGRGGNASASTATPLAEATVSTPAIAVPSPQQLPSPAPDSLVAGSSPAAVAPSSPVTLTRGWLTIEAPFELEIYEGATLLGTTKSERLSLLAGPHDLRLVSVALRYETSINVEIPAGIGITTRVAAPNGTLSLNAQPWANVSLDGKPLGTTPVMNLSVPVGSHEVVWRHPKLGERRQRAVVTARGPVTILIDLRK